MKSTEETSPLLVSLSIGRHVSRLGFDWHTPLEAIQKVKEEISELEKALESGQKKEVAQEIGDIFFSLANVSRLLRVNPERALMKTNTKFRKRFSFVKKELKKQGKRLNQASLEEMDRIWEESKKR